MLRPSNRPERPGSFHAGSTAARESHGHPLSTTTEAARLYRTAQHEVREPLTLLSALRMAMVSDPHFAVAAFDLAALGGVPPPPAPTALHTWERHHIEVVLSATRGTTCRAVDLLRDHLSEVGCDPIATTVVLDATRGERLDDLRDRPPCWHTPPTGEPPDAPDC
jgi:hypothetical protein